MRLTVWLALALLIGASRLAHAQYGPPAKTYQGPVAPEGVAKDNLFQGVEYISGHTGFEQKKQGQLAILPDGITFYDVKGKRLFSFPIGTVRSAEHTRDVRDPSVGKKLLFSALAGDRKQDFLTITTETESNAEGVVFKVKQNSATGIARPYPG
jgi:hypothetical protein